MLTKSGLKVSNYPYDAHISRSFFERACKSLPEGNSRYTLHYSPFPLYAAKGEGSRIIDVDGVSRLDFVNNYSSYIHGHCHPDIVRAVKDQLEKLMAAAAPTLEEIELAELLCSRIASVEKIRFCNSGTEAVMMAIKAARAFTSRPKIAKVEGAYHGSYDYAEMSLSPSPADWGSAESPNSIPPSRGTPDNVRSDVIILPFNDVESTTRLLELHGKGIAAVIIDPLPSRLNYAEASANYIRCLRTVSRNLGQLLIFDEVYSLRLAYGGSQSLYDVTPDLTTLGKIIGGGMPIGAVGGSAKVMQVFEPINGKPAVPHGGTLNANPLAMVAGKTGMSLLTPLALQKLERQGDQIRAELREIAQAKSWPVLMTGRGSLVGIRLSPRPSVDYRSFRLTADEEQLKTRFHIEMLNRGMFIPPSGAANLSTVMTDEDIAAFVAAAVDSMREIFS